MNIRNILISTASVATLFAAAGCGEPIPVRVAVATPPPPVMVVREPAPVVVEKKQVLVGLPLRGAQLEVLGDIEFDTASANIRQTPQSIGILTTLANAGRAYPQISRMRVEGHTDSDGNEANNQRLSEQRAQAVVKWLVEHGIEPRRLTAAGCGSRVPEVPNTTPENKQRNRRTEFHIEEVEGARYEIATPPCTPNPVARTHR